MATKTEKTVKSFTIVTVSYFLHELYEETSNGKKLVDVKNFIKPLEDLVAEKGGTLLTKRAVLTSK